MARDCGREGPRDHRLDFLVALVNAFNAGVDDVVGRAFNRVADVSTNVDNGSLGSVDGLFPLFLFAQLL